MRQDKLQTLDFQHHQTEWLSQGTVLITVKESTYKVERLVVTPGSINSQQHHELRIVKV